MSVAISYMSILLLIIVPVIIFLVVIIYQLLYKRHINHTLNGEASHFRYIEPFNFIIVAILIILTIFVVMINSKVNEFDQRLADYKNKLVNEINNSENTLRSKIEELEEKINEIEECSRWITDTSIYITNITEDRSQVNTKINFTLSEMDSNSKIFLVIINKDNLNDSQKIEVTDLGLLTFSQEVLLDANKNYIIEVLTENVVRSKKEQLENLMLRDIMNDSNRFKVNGVAFSEGENFFLYGVEFMSKHYHIESLKLSKIIYKFYDGDTLISEKDVTNEIYKSSYDDTDSYHYKGDLSHDLKDQLYIEVVVEDQLGIHSLGKTKLVETNHFVSGSK